MNDKTEQELNTFIEEWKVTPDKNSNKATFLRFKDHLASLDGVTLDFIARPGVTYSLRAVHDAQKDKELFVMVDVIEDVERWLSVCFYGEMITDPESKGDMVPGGLLGEDATCFDLEDQDEVLISYIEARLGEACQNCRK
jgi:hypothetical protein